MEIDYKPALQAIDFVINYTKSSGISPMRAQAIVYLMDRYNFRVFSETISRCDFVSTPNGPISLELKSIFDGSTKEQDAIDFAKSLFTITDKKIISNHAISIVDEFHKYNDEYGYFNTNGEKEFHFHHYYEYISKTTINTLIEISKNIDMIDDTTMLSYLSGLPEIAETKELLKTENIAQIEYMKMFEYSKYDSWLGVYMSKEALKAGKEYTEGGE